MENVSRNQILLIDFSLLFDFSSITFALLKQIEEDNSKQFKFPNLNLASFHVRTFQQFVDEYCKDTSQNKDELYNYIKSSKLYTNVKPKLYMLAQLMYLLSNNLINSNDVVLYIEEQQFLEMIPENELSIFKNLTSINTIHPIDIVINNIIPKEPPTTSILHFGDKDKINNQLQTINNLIIIENAKTKPNNNLQTSSSSNENAPSNYFNSFDKFISTFFPNHSNQYTSYMQNEFILKYSHDYINKQFSFLPLWKNYTIYDKQILIEGKIVDGVKRGSKLLGIPTANIEMNSVNSQLIQQLINGVYFGLISFKTNNKNNTLIEKKSQYKGVLSIGYNPFFNNNSKTIEVFLIDYNGDDFYGEEVSLQMKGYSRSEENFANLSELVTTISYDIILFNTILDNFI